MQRLMNRLPLLVLVAAVALVAAAVAAGATARKQATTVTFWNQMNAEESATAKTLITAFEASHPDIKIDMPTNVAAGDYVVGMGTFEGTNTGPMGPMKPTKKAVKGQFAEVALIKDGKIAQLWRFRNGLSMAVQMGLAPAPGAGAPANGSGGSAAPAKDAPKGDAPKGDAPKKDAPKAGSDAKKSG